MTDHSNRPKLSRNQDLVFRALAKAGTPLSAYSILDAVRDKGIKAPLQVYRALEKLCELELVHRIDSLNAFIICSHKGCATTSALVFEICDDCGSVSELSDDIIANQIASRARSDRFELNSSTIELHGRCQNCNQM